MGNTSDKEYNDRVEKLGLSTKKEISDILKEQQKDDAAQTPIVFVDVRSEAEVAAKSLQGNWDVKYVPCTRDDASPLQSQADSLLPDKNGKMQRRHFSLLCLWIFVKIIKTKS
jgi:hypothetical protein